jgi:hypothetical protein
MNFLLLPIVFFFGVVQISLICGKTSRVTRVSWCRVEESYGRAQELNPP